MKGRVSTTKIILSLLDDVLRLHRDPMTSFLKEMGKTERAIQAALSRLEKVGQIRRVNRGGEAFFSLTDEGRAQVPDSPHRLKRKERRWDGRWYLVNFDIPEKDRRMRNLFRQYLVSLGCGRMQKSLWISPYNLSRSIESTINEMGLEKYVETFSAQHLGRSDGRTLASWIWKLEKVKGRYSEFIDHYNPLLSRLKREARAKGQETKLLRLKRKIEKDLAQILRDDPQLPDNLLPSDWKGEEAYRLFEECYRLILSRINPRRRK